MAEVLVLAEHSGGTVKKVTFELLTLARRFGEPAVVSVVEKINEPRYPSFKGIMAAK